MCICSFVQALYAGGSDNYGGRGTKIEENPKKQTIRAEPSLVVRMEAIIGKLHWSLPVHLSKSNAGSSASGIAAQMAIASFRLFPVAGSNRDVQGQSGLALVSFQKTASRLSSARVLMPEEVGLSIWEITEMPDSRIRLRPANFHIDAML